MFFDTSCIRGYDSDQKTRLGCCILFRLTLDFLRDAAFLFGTGWGGILFRVVVGVNARWKYVLQLLN